jgi:[acyl-carrier-protein] S-malonyltransferase
VIPPAGGKDSSVVGWGGTLLRMLQISPTAALFPGQGSQTPDMRDLVARVRPDLLDAVTELTGEDPFPRVEQSTRFAQPAIFCASLAGWTLMRNRLQPVALAGHSLGELSALAAAGVLDELDALRLVALRGHLMEVSETASRGGAMLAVQGATPAHAAALAARHDVIVANDNAPTQVVLSGAHDAIEAAEREARCTGFSVTRLGVAAAFHSPHMRHAVQPFREALHEVRIHRAAIPVLSCATARRFRDPAEELAQALVRPVRWRETMIALAEAGACAFVDAGPGAMLAKLAPRCVPGISTVTRDSAAA